MSFSDNLNTNNQAQATNEKAISEISALDSAITQEEKMITEIYQQIGIEYYNKHKDNADADFQFMISRVKGAQQRVAEYRNLIENIRAVVLCRKCGAEIATGLGMTSCVRCGTPVFTNESPLQDSTIKCFACGEELALGTNFCTQCGKPMTEIVAYYNSDSADSTPEAEQESAEIPEESIFDDNGQNEIPMQNDGFVSEDAPDTDSLNGKCPMCGSDINDEMFFCTSCGEKLK